METHASTVGINTRMPARSVMQHDGRFTATIPCVNDEIVSRPFAQVDQSRLQCDQGCTPKPMTSHGGPTRHHGQVALPSERKQPLRQPLPRCPYACLLNRLWLMKMMSMRRRPTRALWTKRRTSKDGEGCHPAGAHGADGRPNERTRVEMGNGAGAAEENGLWRVECVCPEGLLMAMLVAEEQCPWRPNAEQHQRLHWKQG